MKYVKVFLVVTLLLGSVTFASDLSCTPAPCTTPTARITPISTTFGAVEFSLATALNSTAVVVGSNYYKSGGKCNSTLNSKFAVWSSSDPGAVAFSGGCVSPPTNVRYTSDPITAAYASGTSTTYYTGVVGNDSSSVICGDCDSLLRSSTNGGTSWSSPFGSWESLDFDSSDPQRLYIGDFDHMVVDKTVGTHDGCGYVAGLNFSATFAHREIEVAHGCPAGTGSWTNVAVDTELTGGVVDFTHLSLDASGTVYLTYTKCATRTCATSAGGDTAMIYFSKSTDGGSTWSTPVNIFNVLMSPYAYNNMWPGGFGKLPNTNERLTPQALIAVEQTSPTVTLVAVYETWNTTGKYMEVDARRSTDGGTNWTPENRVSGNQTHDQFLPCVADDGSGKVAVMWLDRRRDTNNKKYDAYVASDTGGTWSSALRLSASSSDPAKNGLGGAFLGDYTGCGWWKNGSGGEYFLGVWPDTSNGTNAVGMIAGYNP